MDIIEIVLLPLENFKARNQFMPGHKEKHLVRTESISSLKTVHFLETTLTIGWDEKKKEKTYSFNVSNQNVKYVSFFPIN